MKKVLLVTFYPGPTISFIPIIREFNKYSNLFVVNVLAYGVAAKILKKHDIKYFTLENYNLSIGDKNYAQFILNTFSPDLLLTGLSCANNLNKNPMIEQKFILEAKKRHNVEILSLLDSYGYYDYRFLNGLCKPDGIFVPDELEEKKIKLYFKNNIHTFIVGYPCFDNLNFDEKLENKNIYSKLNINSNNTILLFASQPIQADFGESLGFNEFDVIEELIKELNQINYDNLVLIIKLHPRENKNKYQYLRKMNFKHILIILSEYEIADLIKLSSLVISVNSFALIEAYFLNKICISFQPGLKDDELDQICDNYISKKIKKFNCIGSTILSYLNAKNSNMSSIRKDPPFKGCSSIEIVKIINNFLFRKSIVE